MVCVQYTAPIVQAKPIVSNLEILGVSGTSGLGIKWYQDISGSVSVYVDGVFLQTLTGVGGSYAQAVINVGSLTVNHQICVE